MEQVVVNWVLAALGATLGWLLKSVWNAIGELKADMKQIERDLPGVYVRKDDFKAAIADIKDDMRDLRGDMRNGFAKLDTTLNSMFKKMDGAK